tara:strand:+ start:351 stop:689 length:339 start_codon:yes stop_codon:yes gene_type:complete
MGYNIEKFKEELTELRRKKEQGSIYDYDLGRLVMAECIEKLIIPVVVGGFFTASDVGKEFEILANTSGHKFNMGEIVTLRETNADSESYLMYNGTAGKDDYWWCNFADIKTK